MGLDERAEKHYTEIDFNLSAGIVLGGEGKGLHELVRERCDFLVSIPTTGPVRALNVSVAAGIVLFEAVRQRAAATDPETSRSSRGIGSRACWFTCCPFTCRIESSNKHRSPAISRGP